jgi:hypothetical protein
VSAVFCCLTYFDRSGFLQQAGSSAQPFVISPVRFCLCEPEPVHIEVATFFERQPLRVHFVLASSTPLSAGRRTNISFFIKT